MADRLTEFENRLSSMETSHNDLATAFASFQKTTATNLQTLTDAFDEFKDTTSEKLDGILVFASGANTILGLARKHWKRIFIFGAGFVSATGAGNPMVQRIASYIPRALGVH